MKKQIAIFISGFTVIGILLLTLSTIITVPFKTTETLLSTRSVNWYDDTISLNPRESMNLSLPDLWPSPTLAANGTVIQLKISNIGGLTVKLYYRAHAYQGEKLGLNESFGNAGPTELGTRWLNIYWAPVGPIGESLYPDATRGQASYIITINLENLEHSQEQVMFKVNFYDFAATTEREHITYRPAIDYYFGYLGVTLLTASAVLELSDLQRRRTHGSLLKEKSTSV